LDPIMTTVSETTPIAAPHVGLLPTGHLSDVAAEAERLARSDPAAAREHLAVLRGLVDGLPVASDAADLARILDQLDADLGTGAVRSITGLARRVRQLERRAI
jgi:hypothetical protein